MVSTNDGIEQTMTVGGYVSSCVTKLKLSFLTHISHARFIHMICHYRSIILF